MSNTDDDVEQQELSFMAGGNSNGTATLEDTLVISYKLRRQSFYKLSVFPLVENFKNQYGKMDFYNSMRHSIDLLPVKLGKLLKQILRPLEMVPRANSK